MQDPPEIEDVISKLESKLPLCRVCLNISMKYIEFESTLCLVNGLEITYGEGFKLIVPSLVALPKNLSQVLCLSCGRDLLNAYLFRKQVENANIILGKVTDSIEDAIKSDSIEDLRDNLVDSDRNEDVQSDVSQQEGNIYLEEDSKDMFVKEDENLPQTIRSKRKKKKSTEIDVTWPASPKNSLYTDSDSDSSENSIIKSQLEEETLSKEPAIWICNDCGEICMSRGMLRTHRRHHQVASYTKTKCRKCDKSVETIEELENHLCFHKFAELISIETGKLSYRCKLCERKYRSEIDFVDHLNIHKDKKPHACKFCADTFHTKHLLRVHTFRFHRSSQRKIIKATKRSNIEKKEKCPHCYKLVRKSFMEIHKEVHFGPRNSMCTECGKQFGSRLALRTHTLIHKQSGEFLCHICNKMCVTIYALKSHIQFKHLIDKSLIGRKKLKYQCEDCGLVFQYPSKLRDHQRRHNRETPFKCPHCNRSYLRKDQFNIHMRYHNNDLPYKCDRCDKSYATRNNLSEHTKSVHDNITYGCDKCDQKFKSVTGLRKHKFLHTGYPYVCPICGLGQPFRSGMKAHLLRVHKDTFTEEEFEETFPVVIPKSGFRRPKP